MSVFYPAEIMEQARLNASRWQWARAIRDAIVAGTQPWLEMSDDDLWGLMFGNTIRRSWMVWSNGYCPACKESVPMYNWKVDALHAPWKLRCPHCSHLFPTNDFHAFYRSGLDERGVFDPARADRSLLFNAAHLDVRDPLFGFGVDDGEGCVEGGKRWRFIGAYLIYGQWKQLVLSGICDLAVAYLLTGKTAYAHKAAVLLDRVADLYPTFDFGREGMVYERQADAGYVSTWHDACEETREMAIAYDIVRDAMAGDADLVAFLSRKARECALPNAKRSAEDIRRNIEDGILRDALSNRHKIRSNFPRTEVAVAVMMTILGWPRNRGEVLRLIDETIAQATAVDGVTGEKGLSSYSAYTIQALAQMLETYARLDPDLIRALLDRHPTLRQTYRFHLDTWCLEEYYPQCGDCGSFAAQTDGYRGVVLQRPHVQQGTTGAALVSMFSFLWRLYAVTGEADYARLIYRANGNTVEGLPHDLFAPEEATVQRAVERVIEHQGAAFELQTVDNKDWHLAILRSGRGRHARVAWLNYGSGGRHGHADGMNLGLFAEGLDLMPDFGYPPVNHGGWDSPQAVWYGMSAAHNTVVVDGRDHVRDSAARTTLWGTGERFRVVRASGFQMIAGQQFERTLVMVDLPETGFYLVDVFRVIGGADHAKFMHSHFGRISAQGLSLEAVEDYGFGTLMRNFRRDPHPQPGWTVDWQVEDRYGYLQPGKEVHLRYTDLTTDAEALLCEGWVQAGGYDARDEAWIPRILTRRRAETPPLASTFVGVIEPCERSSNIVRIRRVPLRMSADENRSDAHVAVEILLADGRCDLVVALDTERLGTRPPCAEWAEQGAWKLKLRGQLCVVRTDARGCVQRVAAASSTEVAAGGLVIELREETEFIEVALKESLARVTSGNQHDVRDILLGGKRLAVSS